MKKIIDLKITDAVENFEEDISHEIISKLALTEQNYEQVSSEIKELIIAFVHFKVDELKLIQVDQKHWNIEANKCFYLYYRLPSGENLDIELDITIEISNVNIMIEDYSTESLWCQLACLLDSDDKAFEIVDRLPLYAFSRDSLEEFVKRMIEAEKNSNTEWNLSTSADEYFEEEKNHVKL
ncbi:hypothetical protein [Lactococcus fujiensis]|uniref:Uncharacterized protein n=1 Tax=Lactococcus fujiensis JCM 16395 TaxID=1291764 RepID=A0A2A5RIE5_9LACT|nr:hypothetical protein [Lactococcus fujiensis]PCR98891.1 hypothetical protein RT41_GL000630 [Lactococcus fujiensis JCM 16395]